MELLAAAGVDQPARLARRRCCRPRSTTRCATATQALTGPVARGDAGTVAAHVRELGEVSPEAPVAYVALARVTADRALAAGCCSPTPPRRCSTCCARSEEELR